MELEFSLDRIRPMLVKSAPHRKVAIDIMAGDTICNLFNYPCGAWVTKATHHDHDAITYVTLTLRDPETGHDAVQRFPIASHWWVIG